MAIIKFIGTGSGKASLKRNFSSILIHHNNYNLLIDCGDGISKALLQQNIEYNSIDAVLISHLHPDHYSGLASLIVQFKMMNRKNDFTIFIHTELKNYIKKFLNHSYLFKERLGFNLQYKSFLNDKTIKISDYFSFIAKQNSHLDKYRDQFSAYKIPKSSSSFKFTIDDKTVIFSSDIGEEKDLFLFSEQSPEVYISELTHISIAEIDNLYKCLKPQKLIFTHLDDQNEAEIGQYLKKLEKEAQNKVYLAHDGFEITF